ncbi:hypothetical protein CHU98_g9645 [Xylaria longipes]|nr:hypothetical protein CHU98_g9645 [Xylaria longipes]
MEVAVMAEKFASVHIANMQLDEGDVDAQYRVPTSHICVCVNAPGLVTTASTLTRASWILSMMAPSWFDWKL